MVTQMLCNLQVSEAADDDSTVCDACAPVATLLLCLGRSTEIYIGMCQARYHNWVPPDRIPLTQTFIALTTQVPLHCRKE